MTTTLENHLPGSAEWIDRHGLSPVMACRLGQLALARRKPEVFAVEADLGDFFGFPFRDEFPDRYVDVGIAEASLIGVAAGLAMRGKVPYVNTFASFALMRACEQVRLEICYHDLPVKIAGNFAGLQSGASGPTHHCLADVAIARAFPNMTVVAPGDAVAMYHLTMAAGEWPGPVFLRMGMDDVPQVYGPDASFEIGEGIVLREGSDLTLVASGPRIVAEAVEAGEVLAAEGVDARVIDLHTIKPIDRELLVAAARETGLVITVEEHSIHGGMGSAVAEVLSETHPVPMRILGVPDTFCEALGTHDEHLRRYELDAEGIVASALSALAKKGGGA